MLIEQVKEHSSSISLYTSEFGCRCCDNDVTVHSIINDSQAHFPDFINAYKIFSASAFSRCYVHVLCGNLAISGVWSQSAEINTLTMLTVSNNRPKYLVEVFFIFFLNSVR